MDVLEILQYVNVLAQQRSPLIKILNVEWKVRWFMSNYMERGQVHELYHEEEECTWFASKYMVKKNYIEIENT